MPQSVDELVRRFEPILYFHPDERFLPSDAKRFLEHCSLWKANAPFDKPASWSGPLIASEKIAAAGNEVRPGDSYLGERVNNLQRFLLDNNSEERFLDLAGWRFEPGDGSVVEQLITGPTGDEENRFAHRDLVAKLYNDATEAKPALRDSKAWYHAEFFDSEQLRELLVEKSKDRFPKLPEIFKENPNMALLCYYYFFPGHDEGLPCGNPNYASYVGEWACMAVRLDRDDPQDDYHPTWIGLSSRRDIGALQGLDEKERRVAMNARRWGHKIDVHARLLPETIGDHPKIFVAAGTHGLHLQSGNFALNPFTPDVQPQRCGKFDSPEPTKDHSDDGFSVPGPASFYKLVATGLLGLGPIGFAVALGWALLEDNWGVGISAVGTAPVDDDAQADVTAEPGKLGKVIHPKTLSLTEPGAELIPWAADKLTIDQRDYTHLVDRNAQVWWPNPLTHDGFRGRWGPRCSLDPFARRAGMRFPDFAQMFFVAMSKQIAAGA